MVAETTGLIEHLVCDNTLATFGSIVFALSIGHVIADYPLQGAYIARAKHPHLRMDGEGKHDWIVALFAHVMIQAGAVWLITGIIWLALIELVLHWFIDILKVKGKTSLIVDQALHYLCKIGYAGYITYALTA